MSYFPVIKIVDANGNIVYLADTENLLTEIRDTLKAIRIILDEMAETNITEEDTNGY